MESRDSKKTEVLVDIESGEASHAAHVKRDPRRGKILSRLASGILNYNGSGDGEARTKPNSVSGGLAENRDETLELLVDKKTGEQQSRDEKERRKGGKFNKAAKPPRPPNGPTLDAADMRLIKEITKIAMKKRERAERIKALKKMQGGRNSSPPSSSSSCGSTVSAMLITVFFFLLLMFQGFSINANSNIRLMAAPQPAPETVGLTAFQFYETAMSDDGDVPSFLPPESSE